MLTFCLRFQEAPAYRELGHLIVRKGQNQKPWQSHVSGDALPAGSAQLLQTEAPDLYRRFTGNFRAIVADDLALLTRALALRFQVYCIERRFEDPSQFPDGLESDEFDRRAVHSLLSFSNSSEAIGTCRLIPWRPGERELPVQTILWEEGVNLADHLPLETTGEVSRFLISKSYRLKASASDPAPKLSRMSDLFTVLPCLGLVQALLRASRDTGVTHWAAVMEPKLLRMLATMGIHFRSVGSLVSHHGLRQPCFCAIDEMLSRLYVEQSQHWDVVTDGGALRT